MNLDEVRARMVKEQLAARGIRDSRVLAAMLAVERHRFIPPEYADHAYDDGPLPIGDSQTISQPYMVALTCEAAALTGTEKVLEVGTGSGYEAAVLSHLAREVYSIECIEHLHQRARVILGAMELANVHLVTGDGSEGYPAAAPYDAIIVSAAMPHIPLPMLRQLGPGGRLVAPIGEEDLQSLVRVSLKNGHWQEEYFGECRYVKMTGRQGFVD
ncbi:MAG TPA: protein-L-isoaspartate(D-aspartate) O-methyltransferase [Candidatus Binataceae bacterium]|nr:protein-L-isoaspartate(D-aspartate) O-methyltransferase [Candidatus Binataceae bacterium]